MRSYEPRGAAAELLTSRAPEVLISGPAGTGKSLASLMKLHITLAAVPGTQALLVRSTLAALTSSTIVSFEKEVASQDLASGKLRFHGGSAREAPGYLYPNGSKLAIGGLDNPGRVLSTQYTRIHIDEADQVSVTAHETLATRLRGLSGTYKQLVLSCNPAAPSHWLKERADSGKMQHLHSLHVDNPYLVNRDGTFTPDGVDYMARLDSLSGVRRLRYRDGLWVAQDGQVFDAWSDSLNLVDPFAVPEDWRAVWTVDFGYSNSFVWQQWRIDPDGRAFLTHEIARRQRLVEDHARDIRELMEVNGWKRPEAIVCDHDSEDRATLERHLKMPTTPALKGVSRGVQLTQARIRPAGDGRPRLLVFRDATLRTDPLAATDKRPRGLAAEVGGYVWATERGADGIPKEAPAKVNDHSCDAARYLVAYLDWHGTSKMGNPAKPAAAEPKQGSTWSRPVGR